jgi:protein-S-isoprenylcysteine O-methyltransferase Ste14
MSSDTVRGVGPDIPSLLRKAVVRTTFFAMLTPALAVLTSGEWSWRGGWLFIGTMFTCIVLNTAVLTIANPAALARRMARQPGPIRGWDAAITAGLAVSWLMALPVAGLDWRFGWFRPMVLQWQITGALMLVLGDCTFLWATAVNPFFTKLVHVQKEAGHVAITHGPYRYVRHPGYVGFILCSIGTALALGSPLAAWCSAVAVFLLVIRTALEDRALRLELPGYAVYAERVRFRLLPGVW